MKYYLIAGEASGDLHASNLVKAIHPLDPSAILRGWGGDRMSAAGVTIVKHYRELAFMGFVEVLLNLRTIFRNLAACKRDIEAFNPDVLVLIDYPGFNMRIAEWAKARGIKVIYYISPQIWAWRARRVHRIHRIVDEMMVILPFEAAFYERYGYSVHYVGHPLLDALAGYVPPPDFREQNGLTVAPIIALLPGSRKQEIRRILPVMLTLAERYPALQFVVAGAPSMERSYYEGFLAVAPNAHLVSGQTYDLLSSSEVALVASGTATLETALLNVPEAVCYRGGAISVWIARRLIKIRFISLVNLIMDEEVVRELIQEDCTPEALAQELTRLRTPEAANAIRAKYATMRELLGNAGASKRAATIVTAPISTLR